MWIGLFPFTLVSWMTWYFALPPTWSVGKTWDFQPMSCLFQPLNEGLVALYSSLAAIGQVGSKVPWQRTFGCVMLSGVFQHVDLYQAHMIHLRFVGNIDGMMCHYLALSVSQNSPFGQRNGWLFIPSPLKPLGQHVSARVCQ